MAVDVQTSDEIQEEVFNTLARFQEEVADQIHLLFDQVRDLECQVKQLDHKVGQGVYNVVQTITQSVDSNGFNSTVRGPRPK